MLAIYIYLINKYQMRILAISSTLMASLIIDVIINIVVSNKYYRYIEADRRITKNIHSEN